MNDVFFFFVIIGAIAGGGASIEYYAAIRSVSRTDLEKFESQLPRLLRIIYFNRENAFVYDGVSKISGMDYLLNPKRSKSAALAYWIACVSFFVAIPILILAREYRQFGYFPERSVMYTAASLVIYIRVAFFGWRIGKL
jgi:hypothetical protein